MPLVLTQMNDAVTYFMEVLASDAGMYGAIAPKDKQAIAVGFAALLAAVASLLSLVGAYMS